MAKHHGQEGRVYLQAYGQGVVNVCELNHWEISTERDRQEVTSFCDANKTYVLGKPDLTGTISGFWDDTNDALWQASTGTQPAQLVLYPSHLVPDFYFSGPAWIDASMTTDAGSPVTVEGSFAAAGTWHLPS
jgi:hypothetical protein